MNINNSKDSFENKFKKMFELKEGENQQALW